MCTYQGYTLSNLTYVHTNDERDTAYTLCNRNYHITWKLTQLSRHVTSFVVKLNTTVAVGENLPFERHKPHVNHTLFKDIKIHKFYSGFYETRCILAIYSYIFLIKDMKLNNKQTESNEIQENFYRQWLCSIHGKSSVCLSKIPAWDMLCSCII
jgi:hypothetical protein